MLWLKKLFGVLTNKERVSFILAAAGAVVCAIILAGMLLAGATKSVPAAGGQYVEGMVGQPEYVNPVLAYSPADQDLVKLVYQNLYDIADSVTPSTDGTTWTVHLKDGLLWQDGQKLTADDVVFTVQSIENKDANSPLYASWQNVQVQRQSELAVQFTLSAPYALFENNLKNLYILPKHLFADAPPGNWYLSDYNLKPVGSGPYRFVSYNKDSDGFITSYNLTAWGGTSSAHPLIQDFDFKFFNDDNALVASFNAGQIDGFGGASNEELATIDRPYNIYSWRTSSGYAVFFNTSNNIALQDANVREALGAAVDRSDLVNQVFGLSGAAQAMGAAAVPSYGPIPPGMPYYAAPAAAAGAASATASSSVETPASDEAAAVAMLDNAGWSVSTSTGFRAKKIGGSVIPLSVTLTVPNIGFLTRTADYLARAWQAIGVQVNVTPAAPSDIMANAIKNRSYEALLFGETLGPSSDLYSFWDSSQRFYPGLNLAIYGSNAVDRLIEKARTASSTDAAAADLAQAQATIENDAPAVFLYSPDYLYVADKNVRGITTGDILTDPSNRFLDIGGWYLNTSRIFR